MTIHDITRLIVLLTLKLRFPSAEPHTTQENASYEALLASRYFQTRRTFHRHTERQSFVLQAFFGNLKMCLRKVLRKVIGKPLFAFSGSCVIITVTKRKKVVLSRQTRGRGLYEENTKKIFWTLAGMHDGMSASGTGDGRCVI